MDSGVKREIEEAVREQLGHFGLSGVVVIDGSQIELRGKGTPVSVGLAELGEQWALLPPDMRKRRVGELARRLGEAQRAAGVADGGGEGPPLKLIGMIVAGVVGFAGIWAGVRYYVNSQAPPPPAPSGMPRESKSAEQERLARVCSAMRSRIYQGASFASFDASGWAVELWLASRSGKSPADDPSWKGLVRGEKLSPDAAPAFARITDGSAAIAEGFPAEIAARAPEWKGATLVLGGGYARAFFDADQRSNFLSLADKLATSTGAELGALYSRCAHLPMKHDVGAWFRGADPPSAAAAMVYSMSFFTETPTVDRALLAAKGEKSDLDALRLAASEVDAPLLTGVVGIHGGTVASPGKWVTVTFPIGGPARASSASRTLAGKIGVGVGAGE